mmetsp:Transcript_30504/g.30815  ORF Transcript_30504/g.30815 Transcript_30504/m.30815 type:complete len:105 (+) Transcript_30504:511-825(+)
MVPPIDNPSEEPNPHLTHISREVHNAGMNCEISLNPRTPLEIIYPLLQTELIDMVDLLIVEPGFGGQLFQICVLNKIVALRAWIGQQEIVVEPRKKPQQQYPRT